MRHSTIITLLLATLTCLTATTTAHAQTDAAVADVVGGLHAMADSLKTQADSPSTDNIAAMADSVKRQADGPSTDSIAALVDSLYEALQADPELALPTGGEGVVALPGAASRQDSTARRKGRDWSTWHPSPQRALWLALVIPGGGQIYNRKYWKLPIVYGGFVGCIYALLWNNSMYKDYAQAYLDIMDDDPGTASYNKFLHLGRQITPENEERYKQVFKSRKDKYRRWRDLSFFVMLGIYAISVIDAYVDAELSDFDISKDLSLKVRPAVIRNGSIDSARNPLQANSLGVSCSLKF